MIDERRNHPSHRHVGAVQRGLGPVRHAAHRRSGSKTYDPTPARRTTPAAGPMRGVGDVNDMHRYPGPGAPKPEADARRRARRVRRPRPAARRATPGRAQANWGYRGFTTHDGARPTRTSTCSTRLHPLIGTPGLSAAVYTQTTDVEIEVNGLMTYDRARHQARRRARPRREPRALHAAAGDRDRFVDDLTRHAGRRGATRPPTPADGWMSPAFDDAAWTTGPGGFGTPQHARRRRPHGVEHAPTSGCAGSFELPAELHVGESAAPAAPRRGRRDLHQWRAGREGRAGTRPTTNLALTPAGRAALRPGRNTIAVHCHQTTGGQYIDVGLVDVVPAGAR